MTTKQPKSKPEEQRRATRQVLAKIPKGNLYLYAGHHNLEVSRIRDISPFGICLELNVVINDDTHVRLKYTHKGMQIAVSGTVVWRKLVRLADPNPHAAYGCQVGIFLHPSDIDANFALCQAITTSASRVKSKISKVFARAVLRPR